MSKTIFTVAETCVGCKSCELACTIEHSCSKTLMGAIAETPPPQRRINIEPVGPYTYPSRCQHCGDASCVTACPTGAMHRHGDTDAVQVDYDRCIGCWMCVVSCPFGGVTADPVHNKALKCDLCPERTAKGEAPACVASCPTKTLLYMTPEEFAAERRQRTANAAFQKETTPPQPNGMEVLRSLKGAQ